MTMTPEAVGYFCQMNIIEHPGPKAQIFLKDNPNALFFGQVMDAMAFRMMPEQAGEVVAFYVSDMGDAPSWERPGIDNWIDADAAYFVIGSTRMGGMGTPEAVSFSDERAAQDFAERHGGQVSHLADIGKADVLGPDGAMTGNIPAAGPRGSSAEDYAERLRGLTDEKKEKP
ncbi:nitrous oxide reductase accessory protein NosL [Paracoccus albus]|uniref:nitrous oxide reductase accessory protein NosL n=1 Tax=Paracoccus albus TaxID=3017784 RepID=UPI0022F031EC|nr:nitrous oxide reductase accessory protein NosL [Paracoccus albus]WBU58950.1 nitrous oxide reductase accessory protein NosL [Paracoccus albus]